MMRVGTADTVQLAAFSGNLQPGLHCARQFRKFANPAPLGLCGFALTTFLLSLVNLQTQDITSPPIVIAPAIAYGGLAQFVAGVW